MILSKKKPVVRSVDIADELGFKKSSVSVAMKNLREKEYITMGNYEKIIIYNMNSPYLFKTRPTKNTLDGNLPLKVSGFRGRMQKIKEITNENITLTNLILSYVVDEIIKYQEN